MAPAGAKPKSKVPMIIGGCCLILVIISCIFGGYSIYAGKQAAEGAGGAFAAELNRVTLQMSLDTIVASCAGDPTGNAAAAQFHPAVGGTYAAVACQVSANTVAAFADGTRSDASVLAGTDDEFHAVAQSLDPSSCYLYTSGAAKVVACQTPEGSFQLLHLENPGSVQ